MRASIVLFVAVSILLGGAAESNAVWPAQVVKYPEDQRQAALVSDDAGGAIVVWADYRSGSDFDIYAQRIDEYGVPLWTPNGVAVCSADSNQTHPVVVADGAGGAVVMWFDGRNASGQFLYAQRVDASGATMWTADGVALNDASSVVVPPTNDLPADVIEDDSGGLIAVWASYTGASFEIFAQRVGGGGAVVWSAGGVQVTNSPPYSKFYPKLVSDGQGGAIMAWEDGTPPDFNAQAQRLDDNGTELWASGGVPMTSLALPILAQYKVAIAADGKGGAIITWTDLRNGGPTDVDIYGQRVSASGVTRWSDEGVPICVETGEKANIRMAADGNGGAFVVWERRVGSTRESIAYQMVDSLGLTWPDCGTDITACAGTGHAIVVPDGRGAAIVAFDCAPYELGVGRIIDYMSATNSWSSTVYGYVSPAEYAMAAVDGGAMLAFTDSLWGSADIYVERIESRYGFRGHPEPAIADVSDVPNDEGERVVVSWDPSDREHIGGSYITHYSLWRATNPAAMSSSPAADAPVPLSDVGRDFHGPAYRVETVAGQTYYWEWVANQDAMAFEGYSLTVETRYDSSASDPGWHHFQVVSHTDDAGTFWPSRPDSGYSVDNLTPAPPAAFAVQYNTGGGNHLAWDPSPEPDVVFYRVYRSTDPDFVPGAANLVQSTASPEWVDPAFDGWNVYYKVAAVDDAGNESGPAVPGAVTAVDDTPVYRFALGAGVPNPFNPTTRIDYSLDVDGPVSLRVYDVSGRLVAVLADGSKRRGTHSEIWDGRDRHGRAVASGVYVYQLRSAGRVLSRKAVLLK